MAFLGCSRLLSFQSSDISVILTAYYLCICYSHPLPQVAAPVVCQSDGGRQTWAGYCGWKRSIKKMWKVSQWSCQLTENSWESLVGFWAQCLVFYDNNSRHACPSGALRKNLRHPMSTETPSTRPFVLSIVGLFPCTLYPSLFRPVQWDWVNSNK